MSVPPIKRISELGSMVVLKLPIDKGHVMFPTDHLRSGILKYIIEWDGVGWVS